MSEKKKEDEKSKAPAVLVSVDSAVESPKASNSTKLALQGGTSAAGSAAPIEKTQTMEMMAVTTRSRGQSRVVQTIVSYPFAIVRFFARNRGMMLILLLIIAVCCGFSIGFSVTQSDYDGEDDYNLCDDFDSLHLAPIWARYSDGSIIHCPWASDSSIYRIVLVCLTIVILVVGGAFVFWNISEYIQHPFYYLIRWLSLIFSALWFVSFVLDTDEVKIGHEICNSGLELGGNSILAAADSCGLGHFIVTIVCDFFLGFFTGVLWLAMQLYFSQYPH